MMKMVCILGAIALVYVVVAIVIQKFLDFFKRKH